MEQEVSTVVFITFSCPMQELPGNPGKAGDSCWQLILQFDPGGCWSGVGMSGGRQVGRWAGAGWDRWLSRWSTSSSTPVWRKFYITFWPFYSGWSFKLSIIMDIIPENIFPIVRYDLAHIDQSGIQKRDNCTWDDACTWFLPWTFKTGSKTICVGSAR